MRRRLTLPPDEALLLLADMRLSITDSISKVKASAAKVFKCRAVVSYGTSKSFAARFATRPWAAIKKPSEVKCFSAISLFAPPYSEVIAWTPS
jgi:hypothetical protein